MIDENFELDAIRAVAALQREPDATRREAARGELMRLTGERPDARRRTRRPLLRMPAWGFGLLSGVAASVAAVVLLVDSGGAVVPASAAAALLQRAAAAPAMVSPLHLAPGEYWYVEDESAVYRGQNNPPTCGNDCYQTVVTRWWVGARDFSSHNYVLAKSADPTMISAPAPNVPMTAAPNSARWGGVGPGYDRIMHYSVMLTAPTAPDALQTFLENWGPRAPGKLTSSERRELLFMNIQGILSSPRVPARMLSSLYKLLSLQPGVKYIGAVTDTLGRSTVAVSFGFDGGDHSHVQYELMFDPTTYVLLDTSSVESGGPGPSPISGYTAYVRSGLVGRIGALPTSSGQSARTGVSGTRVGAGTPTAP
jgi:hypothetical protein